MNGRYKTIASRLAVGAALSLCSGQAMAQGRQSSPGAMPPTPTATLACPARATVASPNFVYLDISTGNAPWVTSLPTKISGPVPYVPATVVNPVPTGWTPNSASAKWISAGGSQIVWVYSYRLFLNIVPCPRDFKCTVTIDAATAADDIGALNLDLTKLTPPGNFTSAGLSSFGASWPSLAGNHILVANTHNGAVGPTGFYLSGKLRRQCF